MLLAAPGQSTTSYPAVLHNSSNVVVPSQKKCRQNNSSPLNVNVNGGGSLDLDPSVASKKLLNTFNSMPKKLRSPNSPNNNTRSDSHDIRNHTTTLTQKKSNSQNNNNIKKSKNNDAVNNSPGEKSPAETANSRENSSCHSNRSSSNNNFLMKTLSVRLNRNTESHNSIPKLIISSKNSNKSTKILESSSKVEQPSSSRKTNCSPNQNLDSNPNSNSNSNNHTDNETIIQSPISIASSSSSAPSSPTPVSVKQPTESYTVPPTKFHLFEEFRSDDRSSNNSLIQDMCHFKPIRSVPITPFKYGTKSRGGASVYSNAFSLKRPQVIKAKSKVENLNENCDERSFGNKRTYRKTVASYKIKKSKLQFPSKKYKSAFASLLECGSEPQPKQKLSSRRSRNVETPETSSPPPSKKRKTKAAGAGAAAAKAKRKPETLESSANRSTREVRNSKAGFNQNEIKDKKSRVSPPVTRSRLKQVPGNKLTSGLPYYAKGRGF